MVNTSFGARSYQFNDAMGDQSMGSIQYRIRQIVDTASATFTSFILDTVTVNVVMACNNTARPLLLFPNPARSQFMLQVNNNEPSDDLIIQIRDAAGKLVYEKRETKPAAIAVYALPSYQLAKGKYFVTVYSHQKRIATETLLKL